jgi:hypothetical protein
MIFGFGHAFGDLNTALAADALASAQIIDKDLSLVSGIGNGGTLFHVNGYVIGKKSDSVLRHLLNSLFLFEKSLGSYFFTFKKWDKKSDFVDCCRKKALHRV